ncbi:MAG: Hint domain-containing protein [Phycisphaerae bacterium]|nr:Hint domain-containing protein [Phycisphaerae bacterium]
MWKTAICLLTAAVTQVSGGATLPDRSYEYGYDGLRRLVDAKLGELDPNGHVLPSLDTPVPRHTEWILDNMGNFSGGDPNNGSVILTTDDGTGQPEYTLTHHATSSDNAIQSVTVAPPGGSPATQAFVYDIAGNLVFDGNWLYQYDGLNRLVQVNTAGSLTAGDFNAAGAPVDPNTFAPGDLMARYAYDGLGRLIVRQVPLSRGIPDAWTPYVQAESYYYDGVRRIQTAIERDPNELVLVAAATLEPAFLLVAERDVLEYVWGPDYVDELVCQYGGAADPNAPSFWALTDANYNVMAIVDGDCEVVEQYVYDPYGGLLAVETLDPNTTVLNRVAHQGLFFERFADDILSPPLAVGAPGVYENRTRKYEPYLSRFLQKDVNEAAQPVLAALVYNARRFDAPLSPVDLRSHYGDGLNLYGYEGGNPVSRRDPAGLSWDDDIDDVIDEQIGHAFYALGTINEGARWASLGLKTAVDIAWGFLPGSGLYDAFKAVEVIRSGRGGFWEAMDIATAAFPLAKFAGDGLQALRGLARGRNYAMRACNCFVAGTLISTTDGAIPIEQVRVGDHVLTRHELDPGNRDVDLPVTAAFEDCSNDIVWLTLETGTLGVTREHEVWTLESGWTIAGNVQIGEHVRDLDGSAVAVVDVKLDHTPTTVYNLEIAGTYTYYAGRAWVHNNSCRGFAEGAYSLFNVAQLPKDQLIRKPPMRGGAPIGIDGAPVEIHHVGQSTQGPFVEMIRARHRQVPKRRPGLTADERRLFDSARHRYWEQQWDLGRFNDIGGGG